MLDNLKSNNGNHVTFVYNYTIFFKVDSARYGIVPAYVTNQNIKKHEELVIDYGPIYANLIEKPKNPLKAWYYELWQEFKQVHSDEQKKYIFKTERDNRNAVKLGFFSD